MDIVEFRNEENWLGSFYELALELGPFGDDAVATRALDVLWHQPGLHGPWTERFQYAPTAAPVVPSAREPTYHGCLTLPDGTEVGCTSYLIRVEAESDWLDLAVPTGMFELRYPVSYPLDRAANPWRAQVDDLFAQLARSIFAHVPFRLGIIGEEASGLYSAATLTREECERGGLVVPRELWDRLRPNRVVPGRPQDLVHIPFVSPQEVQRRGSP